MPNVANKAALPNPVGIATPGLIYTTTDGGAYISNGAAWITLKDPMEWVAQGAAMKAGERYAYSPSVTNSASWTDGMCYYGPFVVGVAGSIATVRLVKIGNSTDPTAIARVGLYAAGADGRPTGAPLATFGTLNITSAATVDIVGLNVAVTPGLYWRAFQFENIPTSKPTVYAENWGGGLIPAGSVPNVGYTCLTQAGVPGALPNPAAPDGLATLFPRIALGA